MPPNMMKISLQVACGYKGQFTTIFLMQQKVVVVMSSTATLEVRASTNIIKKSIKQVVVEEKDGRS